MTAWLRALPVLALGIACHPAPAPADPELVALAARVRAHERNLDRTEALVRRLDAKWSIVVEEYGRAAEAHRSARGAYERAAATYSGASVELLQASNTWSRAKARWDLATQLIMAAAAVDAYNLARTRGSSEVDLREISCGKVSTAKFRRELQARGVNLRGKDIDHIVPRSLGGADHPANYQVLDSSLNRSLGNTWNADKCAAAGLGICAAAVAVSKLCGTFAG